MGFSYTEQSFLDASQQEIALKGWQQRYLQLSCGRYNGSVKSLQIGPFTLTEESIDAIVAQHSAPPSGTLMLGMRIDDATDLVNGVALPNTSVIHVGGRDVHIVSKPNARGIGLTMDSQLFPEFSSRSLGALIPMERYIQAEEFKQWLISLMRELPRQRQNVANTEVLSGYIQDRVCEILASITPFDGHSLTQSYAYSVFSRCRTYLLENPDATITVTKLAEDLRTPEHIIRSAFVQTTGQSPRLWLRLHRLNSARRALLNPLEAQKGVAPIAMEHGFYHLGRFASYYRDTFGELPLTTMKSTLFKA